MRAGREGAGGGDFSSQKLLRRWIKWIGLRRIQEGEQMTGSQRIRPPKGWEARNPVGLNLARTPPENEGRSENPGARGPVGVSSCLSWAGSAPQPSCRLGAGQRDSGASPRRFCGRQGQQAGARVASSTGCKSAAPASLSRPFADPERGGGGSKGGRVKTSAEVPR